MSRGWKWEVQIHHLATLGCWELYVQLGANHYCSLVQIVCEGLHIIYVSLDRFSHTA